MALPSKLVKNMDLISQNYKKGDACPPINDLNKIRVYSFQLCPFAERVLLVLNAKKIPHEIIDLSLRDKPEWLSDKNPEEKVPVIEFDHDHKLITESLVISEYLDEAFNNSGPKLRAEDPYQRARDKMFIEMVSPYISVYGPLVFTKEDVNVLLPKTQEKLQKAEHYFKTRMTSKFLSGKDTPGYVDYMVWPFIERIPMTLEILLNCDFKEYMRKNIPTIYEYRHQMLSDTVVKNVILDYEVILNYFKAFRKNRTLSK